MKPSATIQAELDRQDKEFDLGVDEGYSTSLNDLPAWYFDKSPSNLTARERGYWFGRILKLQDDKTS